MYISGVYRSAANCVSAGETGVRDFIGSHHVMQVMVRDLFVRRCIGKHNSPTEENWNSNVN